VYDGLLDRRNNGVCGEHESCGTGELNVRDLLG
jgi:hypothetical protein